MAKTVPAVVEEETEEDRETVAGGSAYWPGIRGEGKGRHEHSEEMIWCEGRCTVDQGNT